MPRPLRGRKWQCVTTRFTGDSEVGTGALPFRAMRCDPASAEAEMREQVREFMSQCAVDFSRAVFLQPRIQRYNIMSKIRAAGSTAET